MYPINQIFFTQGLAAFELLTPQSTYTHEPTNKDLCIFVARDFTGFLPLYKIRRLVQKSFFEGIPLSEEALKAHMQALKNKLCWPFNRSVDNGSLNRISKLPLLQLERSKKKILKAPLFKAPPLLREFERQGKLNTLRQVKLQYKTILYRMELKGAMAKMVDPKNPEPVVIFLDRHRLDPLAFAIAIRCIKNNIPLLLNIIELSSVTLSNELKLSKKTWPIKPKALDAIYAAIKSFSNNLFWDICARIIVRNNTSCWPQELRCLSFENYPALISALASVIMKYDPTQEEKVKELVAELEGELDEEDYEFIEKSSTPYPTAIGELVQHLINTVWAHEFKYYSLNNNVSRHSPPLDSHLSNVIQYLTTVIPYPDLTHLMLKIFRDLPINWKIYAESEHSDKFKSLEAKEAYFACIDLAYQRMSRMIQCLHEGVHEQKLGEFHRLLITETSEYDHLFIIYILKGKLWEKPENMLAFEEICNVLPVKHFLYFIEQLIPDELKNTAFNIMKAHITEKCTPYTEHLTPAFKANFLCTIKS